MPPFNLFPVLALTFPVLVWLLDGVERGPSGLRASAGIGLGFGFGYFVAGLWWIGSAFLVDADTYAWLMPFAVIGLPLFLAIFPALGLIIARLFWSDGPARILALAFGLGASEWLRCRVLTGFPWNQFGYALADNSILGQAASVVGVEGLTPIAIAVFAAPAVLADPGSRNWRPVVLALAALGVLALFGAIRLAGADSATVPGLAVRIMQPNVPQDDKFRPEAKDEVMARYLALSDRATSPERRGMTDVDVLVWPESAFPFFLARSPETLAQIGALLPKGAVLLTGAARLEQREGEANRRIYNSIHALADDGSIIATYDKVHLVPFGEFLPFQTFLESFGLRQLTRLPGGFSSGGEPTNIVLPNGLKLGPLICYEAIFPTGVLNPADRPDALINVTNDAWFGDTPGPRQHLAQARVRAIEQGLPLLRSANTGISAVIDSWGRIVTALPVGQEGVIDADLPVALPPTLYARYGLYLILFVYLTTIVGAVWGRSKV